MDAFHQSSELCGLQPTNFSIIPSEARSDMNDQTNVEKIAYANTPQTARPDYIYYYVVTAVSSDGSQSAYSNQAVTTVP